jgi:hypothetical protein
MLTEIVQYVVSENKKSDYSRSTDNTLRSDFDVV